MGKRNVLFIVLDTTRRDRVAPFNASVDFTEHIERLADDGTVYMDAVSQSSWTLPSIASMLTGLYPWEHGATQETLHLEEKNGGTLFEQFQDSGYFTAIYTPNAWVSRHMGMTDGAIEESNFFPVTGMIPGPVRHIWNRLSSETQRKIIGMMTAWGERLAEFSEKSGSYTPEVVDRAIDVMEREEDWFLFINLMDSHEPLYPPEEYREKHASDVDPHDFFHSAHVYNTGGTVAWDDYRRLYDAAIDFMDDQIGRLITTLEERDELEDTIIVVAADHGEHLGEHGLGGHILSVSEELIRVPLVVYDPENPVDTEFSQVELRELYQYIQYAAGITDGDYDMGASCVKGGIAWPELHKRNVDLDTNNADEDELDARRRYVRDGDVKVEKKEERDGDVAYRAVDVSTGEEQPVPDRLKEKVDAIGAHTGEGKSLDEKDAEVKQRLSDLGYI